MKYRVKRQGFKHQVTTDNIYFAYKVAKEASKDDGNTYEIHKKSGRGWELIDTYRGGKKE